MSSYYDPDDYESEDGVLIDCPDCGAVATIDDNGVHCSNPSCPSNR